MTVLKQESDNDTILFMKEQFSYSNNIYVHICATAHQAKGLVIPSSHTGLCFWPTFPLLNKYKDREEGDF